METADPLRSQVSDQWTLQAARLQLAFAQVREDPRIDLEVLSLVRQPADVVMIASGGETAVCMGRQQLKSLTLVDMNPAQLALTKLKWHLAKTQSPANSMRLLGHAEMDCTEREVELRAHLESLGLPHYALGPHRDVAALGPDHAGRYEVLFAELRQTLTPHQASLDQMLASRDPQQASALIASGTVLGDALDEALSRVIALKNLVSLFGREATQNPRQAFHLHFAQRIRHAVATMPAEDNPFLWQMLAGKFPEGTLYDWLDAPLVASLEPNFQHGRMKGVLDSMPERSADFVHLSNILDWLSEEDATSCLRSAARVLRSGGRVLVRQLNSTLPIESLSSGLLWDEALGRALHLRDRSFFYTQLHVGNKP
jgi:S-adenosylmethionine-diacylglycerol 3-amino-3-carboxypropyl transferase